MTVRILLADDHRVVRQGLRSLLEKEEDFEIVGEAGDGLTTVAEVTKRQPDIVIMDLTMPGMNGAEATRRLVEENPRLRVLALSMHSDARSVSRMLRAGAAGYVVKDSAYEEIVRAVRNVASGQTFLSPSVMGVLVQDYLRRNPIEESSVDSILTPREREVLQLLAEGKSTKETAELLAVSIKTVESHRKQIMDKLDLHSIAELTKYAIREGVTGLD